MFNGELLCLSFWTPPNIRPRAIQLGKMLPEWLSQGLKPVIVAYDVEKDWDIEVPIYRIPKFSDDSPINKIKTIKSYREKKYIERMYRFASEIIDKHKLKLVFSFSNPQVSNIIGAMLKRRKGISFISHFSDPYSDIPWSWKKYSKKEIIEVRQKEKEIIEQSDKIVFVNEVPLKIVMRKYPEEFTQKAVVIPHSFVESYFNAEGIKNSDNHITLSHIGAFYKQRTPEILFQSVKNASEFDKNVMNKIRIRLIGATLPYANYDISSLNQLVEKYGLDEIVSIEKPVDYKKSIELMMQSDCLVNIDDNLTESPFLPSKVIDYLGSGKPILAITPDGSPTEKVLASVGGKSYNYNQVNQIAEFVLRLCYRKEELSPMYHSVLEFSVARQTKKYIELFENVAG